MENGVTSFLPLPIAEPLLAWYAQNARELPWRENTDAYRVWISEIMLQQTRVEAVKPYFLRLMAALPDINALAEVQEETLLKLWEGLGYYSRARNLQRAARLVMERYGGVLPSDVQELRTLPGIGPYTAGAIASIAYGAAEPAVDGNVLRVLARLSGSELDIAQPAARAAAEKTLRDVIPADNPGGFNQALMELGACVCLPNAAPRCAQCPVAALCRAHREGRETELPVRGKKAPRRIEERTVFLLREHTRVAVRKRSDSGLLAGLWELPNLPGHLEQDGLAQQLSKWEITPVGAIERYARKHIFTHVEWHMRVYALDVQADCLPVGWEWTGVKDGAHALPTAFRVCLRH